MCGIPLGIKDLFCTEGRGRRRRRRILEGFRPEYESTVTRQLFEAGAVMLGKLNMDEFAMGSSNETSCYGNVVNPWKVGTTRDLTPGGSSGGSASAVAADLCLAARRGRTPAARSASLPPSWGSRGLKPTYGRCSRWGIVAFASSLDQAGPMTRTVRDCAIMLQAMAGHDPKDSTSADLPVPDFEAMLTGDIRGKTIGIPKEYRMDGMPGEIEALWTRGAEMLRDAGAKIVDISPAAHEIRAAGLLRHRAGRGVLEPRALRRGALRAPRDARAGRRHHRDVREDPRRGLRARGAARVMVGTYVLSAGFYDAYYNRARKVRALIKRDFDEAFAGGVDAILTPPRPRPPSGWARWPRPIRCRCISTTSSR
jgi:aspartyl-tRNA(Asn)/glutamyl-tRNA(Gln) amidotransferase subunit A